MFNPLKPKIKYTIRRLRFVGIFGKHEIKFETDMPILYIVTVQSTEIKENRIVVTVKEDFKVIKHSRYIHIVPAD